MIFPVPKFMGNGKTLSASMAKAIHGDYRVVVIAYNACLTTVERSVFDACTFLPSNCFQINFSRIGYA